MQKREGTHHWRQAMTTEDTSLLEGFDDVLVVGDVAGDSDVERGPETRRVSSLIETDGIGR